MIGAWAKLLWTSAAVGAVAAAAQLGVSDALGITRWELASSTRDWTALLTWIAFYYAVAVLSGALAGRSLVRRGRRDRVGVRITAALAAALGAGAVVGLAWLSASGVQPPANVNPGLVVSITAGAGVVVGFLLALLALSARPVAAGLAATITWLWLAAIGCAVAGFVTHQPYPSPRLGVLDAPQLAGSLWSDPIVMVGLAAVVGLLVAGFARWVQSGRFGVALAGFGGPAMVAAAYLIAGPGASTDRPAQAEPYVAAMIAAGAGLIASVIIAMPGRRGSRAPRADINLEDLRPIAGDVVSPPGRGRTGHRSGVGDRPDGAERPFGDQPSYGRGGGRPGAAEPYPPAFAAPAFTGPVDAPEFDAIDRPADRPPVRRSDRSSAGGGGWNADSWPGGRPDVGPAGGRQPGTLEVEPESGSGGGSTYRGSSYPSSSSGNEATSVTGALPAMGQPTDAHEAWLRDLGPAGRHSFDDRSS